MGGWELGEFPFFLESLILFGKVKDELGWQKFCGDLLFLLRVGVGAGADFVMRP